MVKNSFYFIILNPIFYVSFFLNRLFGWFFLLLNDFSRFLVRNFREWGYGLRQLVIFNNFLLSHMVTGIWILSCWKLQFTTILSFVTRWLICFRFTTTFPHRWHFFRHLWVKSLCLLFYIWYDIFSWFFVFEVSRVSIIFEFFVNWVQLITITGQISKQLPNFLNWRLLNFHTFFYLFFRYIFLLPFPIVFWIEFHW